MNKLLLTLCVSLISGLAADEESAIATLQRRNEQAVSMQACPAPKPCCKEKCCPCEKPPVCCECYVPSYFDLQCDSGVFFYGDFLYWFAKEDNLSPCTTVGTDASAFPGSTGTTVNVLTPPKTVHHLKTKWDPGFRVGFGYNFDHDGWDFEANYTWYHNKKHQTFSVPAFGSAFLPISPNPGQQALVDPWYNTQIFSFTPFFNSPVFDTVNTRWKLTFNQIDLELGRKFWLGKYTAMRAYAGVRGAWFTTRFNNVGSMNSNFSSSFTFTKYSDNFKDRVWGVGLLGGLQPEWHFCRNFILFSNLDAALLWGKFRVHKKEDYTSVNTAGVQALNYHNNLTGSFYKMQAVLDLALGLRWEETWCYRVRTYLDLGWEQHIWFDTNHRFKYYPSSNNGTAGLFQVTVMNGYEELQGNLMMGGPVVRFRADF